MPDIAPHTLDSLSAREWDLIVIGGGITGAAVLREAARVGLRCLLLEQHDFAWGASSHSGKWVHGGLRHIKQWQLHVTWQSVRERERLSSELPGLITMIPLCRPLFRRRSLNRWVMRAGLFLYDLMAGKRRHQYVHLYEMKKQFPSYEAPSLTGAMCFYEGQTDDARLTLRILQEAQAAGAVALNYTEVIALEKNSEGRVSGVQARKAGDDTLCRIAATQVIAATGVWSDALRQQVSHHPGKRLRPLRGSHLLFSQQRLPIKGTLLLQHPRNRRRGFITLFQGRVLVGHTDLDHQQDPQQDAAITDHEVNDLLEMVQHAFPELGINRNDIIATFAGIRPVAGSGATNPPTELRGHAVWHENGLITISGGNLTTFQSTAREALKRAAHLLPALKKLNRQQPLLAQPITTLIHPRTLSRRQAEQLTGRYGKSAQAMLQMASKDTLSLIPGTETFWFELPWCALQEQVEHLDDLLLRRTRIGLLLEQGGLSLMPTIRELTQPVFCWTDARWDEEIQRYQAIWQQYYSVPDAPENR